MFKSQVQMQCYTEIVFISKWLCAHVAAIVVITTQKHSFSLAYTWKLVKFLPYYCSLCVCVCVQCFDSLLSLSFTPFARFLSFTCWLNFGSASNFPWFWFHSFATFSMLYGIRMHIIYLLVLFTKLFHFMYVTRLFCKKSIRVEQLYHLVLFYSLNFNLNVVDKLS